MVKKFNEFISEGFMTRSLNRRKSDEERIENKIQSNIDEMNEVDMGNPYMTFADIDLEINGEDRFTWEDYLKYKEYIQSTGWDIPTVKKLLDKDIWYHPKKVEYTEEQLDNGDRLYHGKCKKTGETLSFLVEDVWLYGKYLLNGEFEPFSFYDKTNVKIWVVGGPVEDFGRVEVEPKKKKYKIRLVKYKK